MGKVKVRVQYYPKKSFWAFFEKKVPQAIHFFYENGDSYKLNYREDGSLEASKLVQRERDEYAYYRKDGSLERSSLSQPGREEYAEYHPNGKIASLSVRNTDDYGRRISKWDAEGRPIFEYRYDPEKTFEDNARNVYALMNKKLSDNRYRYFVLRFMGALDTTLKDALNEINEYLTDR